ncbi:MAG: acetyl-CoA carboxylase carboxyltransferase subunit alpha [candidate division WOR-3 bacterium]
MTKRKHGKPKAYRYSFKIAESVEKTADSKVRQCIVDETSDELIHAMNRMINKHDLTFEEALHALDIINLIVRDFIQLHGDRLFGDDAAIVCGIGQIDEYPVVIVAEQKGRDIKEKIQRNFGSPHPEGYRKALRIFYFAEKFSLPIVCIVDTPGAYPGVGAEERGIAESIARNLREMALLETPIVVLILGEGCSGGAIAIALGDRILMMENAYYSVISPEGCASILWRDSARAKDAAEAMKITAQDLDKFKIIDRIIPEPLGGAHRDWSVTAQNIKQAIIETLDELLKIPIAKLVQQRVEKYRRMGVQRES